jgi:hypothetical protein
MRFYDLDIDVKNYAKRIVDAGYKCPADINSVSDFVKGLKILNLWGNVIFWPLRANQNAGSGNIVYSLGGLTGGSRLDGTLISNPIWGTHGIILNNPNQYISLSGASINADAFTSLSILSTIASNDSSHLFGLFQYLPTNPTRGPVYSIYGPNGNGVMRISSLTGGAGYRDKGNQNVTNVGIGFYYASAGVSDLSDPVNSTGFVQLNFTRNTTSSGSGTLPYTFNSNLYWLFGFQGSIRNEIASFQIWFSGKLLTQSEILQLQNLYKSTLGKGLNLP